MSSKGAFSRKVLYNRRSYKQLKLTRGLMAEGSSHGRRRFSDKWGKHELDVLAVLSSAFPQWLTSRQIAQRVKAYADSYGELADQAAKAAFAKQFQRDRAKLTAMGIAIESRQPEYSSKSDRILHPTVCSWVTNLELACTLKLKSYLF